MLFHPSHLQMPHDHIQHVLFATRMSNRASGEKSKKSQTLQNS